MAESYDAKGAYLTTAVVSEYDRKRFASFVGRVADRTEKNAFLRLLSTLQPRSTVIDVACGTGRIAETLAAAEFSVVGADVSFEMLKEARLKLAGHEMLLGLVQCEAERLPFQDGSVACITSSRFIAHLPLAAREQVYREMSRVSRHALLISYLNPLCAMGLWRGIVSMISGRQRSQVSLRALRRELKKMELTLQAVSFQRLDAHTRSSQSVNRQPSSGLAERAWILVTTIVLRLIAETYVGLVTKDGLKPRKTC